MRILFLFLPGFSLVVYWSFWVMSLTGWVTALTGLQAIGVACGTLVTAEYLVKE